MNLTRNLQDTRAGESSESMLGRAEWRCLVTPKEEGAMSSRPPLPPFTEESAREKVQAAEDAWNSCDPDRVALAYTEDSHWRNRDEFFEGRDAIREFPTSGKRSRTIGSRRSCGASTAIASPCASNTNHETRRASGGAATATSTGNSTNTA